MRNAIWDRNIFEAATVATEKNVGLGMKHHYFSLLQKMATKLNCIQRSNVNASKISVSFLQGIGDAEGMALLKKIFTDCCYHNAEMVTCHPR